MAFFQRESLYSKPWVPTGRTLPEWRKTSLRNACAEISQVRLSVRRWWKPVLYSALDGWAGSPVTGSRPVRLQASRIFRETQRALTISDHFQALSHGRSFKASRVPNEVALLQFLDETACRGNGAGWSARRWMTRGLAVELLLRKKLVSERGTTWGLIAKSEMTGSPGCRARVTKSFFTPSGQSNLRQDAICDTAPCRFYKRSAGRLLVVSNG